MSNAPEARVSALHILLLSRDETREAAIANELRAGLFDPAFVRVADLLQFSNKCAFGAFNVILVELAAPVDEGWKALAVARKRCPDTPVFFLASKPETELVVESIHRGAADFIAADRLDRLAPAIRAARERRSQQIVDGGFSVYPGPQQEDIYRLIAGQSQDIVCLHAPDRAIQFVTPSVRRVLGYEPAEWVGRHPGDFAHAEDIEAVNRGVQAAVTRDDPDGAVVGRYRHKNGRYVWMETRVKPIRDGDGRITQLMSVSRECTERKRVEETLRRGEQLFEGIAEANRLLLTSKFVLRSLPAVARVLGGAANADRVVVFEFLMPAPAGTPPCALRTEWPRDPARRTFDRSVLAGLDFSDAQSAQQIKSGRVPDQLRAQLEVVGMREMLAFPIVVNGSSWGMIGFDQDGEDDAWSPATRSALGIVALNIGQAIEREQVLGALAESQQRYEALLAGLSEAVFQIDLESRWRFLNPIWEDLTGFTVHEAIGQPFSKFLAPQEGSVVLEGFDRLIAGSDERIEGEMRFRHRLGTEIWLRVIAQPQLDETGRISGVSGTMVDVTQRRLAQEAMRASERKFTAVFEASSDALFLFDNGTDLIVECNPRAIEMFDCRDASELIGTNGSSLPHRPLTLEQVAEGRATLDRGEAWADELQYATRRGRVFWGLFSVVRMAPESLGTTLVRVTDISELKDSEERLRASLGEKEVLLKEVYHRVKNNLQITSALLRMQSRRVKDRVAVEALENSISRVMAMSMVHEKLYQAQNLVSIDFVSFAQSLVVFLNQLTVGSQPGVTIAVKGEPLALSIDQAIPLGLILNELVTNSLKYAYPEGRSGRVGINIGTTGSGAARVVVSDDGVGLPKEVNVEEAAGLGFRIVRMLVEQLHGSLEVESRKGLKVTIEVPPPVMRPPEPDAT